MTVKIEGVEGVPVKINRGSPQGSILGCLLYCITTQFLTKRLGGEADTVRYFPQNDSTEDGVSFCEEPKRETESFLYVDDTTLFDSPLVGAAAKHFTVNRTVASFEQMVMTLMSCLEERETLESKYTPRQRSY